MGTKGGGQAEYSRPAFLSRVGEGEARATVLVLHTLEMHVDLSFSYLRFAEAASFDKKELSRSDTKITRKFKIFRPTLYFLISAKFDKLDSLARNFGKN